MNDWLYQQLTGLRYLATRPREYINEWLDYTPTFFRMAPISHWPRYLFSCNRVCVSVMYTRHQLDLARQEGPWEFHERRKDFLKIAKERGWIE